MRLLSSGRWAVLATSLSAAALAAVLLDASSPVRALVVLAFVLFVPGYALVRLFGFHEPAADVALGCGLSVSLAGAVAGALLAAGAWTPLIGLAILVLVTIAAVVVELTRRGGSAAERQRIGATIRPLVAAAIRRLAAADDGARGPGGATP